MREHRRVVELGVVEPVEQVDRAGPGGRHAHADLAGELGVRGGGEGGELLVAGLDELDLVADLVEGEVQPVGPVARIAVDAPDAPLAQAAEHELPTRSACSSRRATPAAAPALRGPALAQRARLPLRRREGLAARGADGEHERVRRGRRPPRDVTAGSAQEDERAGGRVDLLAARR